MPGDASTRSEARWTRLTTGWALATSLAAVGLLAGVRPLRPLGLVVVAPAAAWAIGSVAIYSMASRPWARALACVALLASLGGVCLLHPSIRGSYQPWQYEILYSDLGPPRGAAIRCAIENVLVLGGLLAIGLGVAALLAVAPAAASAARRRLSSWAGASWPARVVALALALTALAPLDVEVRHSSGEGDDQVQVRRVSPVQKAWKSLRRRRAPPPAQLLVLAPALAAAAGVMSRARGTRLTLAVAAAGMAWLELIVQHSSWDPPVDLCTVHLVLGLSWLALELLRGRCPMAQDELQ